jgi:CubicO group peptidase (beta-lactamase class C family)
MNRRSFFPVLGAMVAAPSLRLRRAAQPDQWTELLASAKVPSFAMVTVDSRGPAHIHRGVRRRGEAAPVDQDTVFAAASLTKPVFASVFLALVREGRIELDRPLSKYLELPNPADPRAATLTARHLLSHSSGWRNWRNQLTDTLTCTFDPGTRWLYSGEGYYFLQRIMEQVTGQPMAITLRQRLFGPLGMTRSSVVGLEALEPHQATGHSLDGEPRTPFGRPTLLALRTRLAARGAGLEDAREDDVHAAQRAAEPNLPALPNFLSPNAASSLLTSTADLGRFLTFLLGPGRDVAREMVTPQVRRNEAIQWGLGLGIEQVNGRPVGWQWGDNPGFKNFVVLDLEAGSGLAIFTNGDRGARVYERVVRGVTGVDHPAFLYV